ncbi:MAG: hypothetical protein GY941_21645 [Planctomycetes bacterium]|nr:hypothetical protein [Planctomycetota bacterium]
MQLFPLLTPSGSDTEVQFNDAYLFAGDSKFTWTKGTSTLLVDGTSTVTSSAVLGVNSAVFQPAVDSVTFFQVLDADGGTPVLNVDTVGEKVGIGTAGPLTPLHVNGGGKAGIAYFESTDDQAYIRIYDNDTVVYVVAKDSTASFGQTAGVSVDNINVDTGGNLGLGVTVPTSQLHTTKGRIVGINRYTTTQTLDNEDHVVFCNTDGGDWTLTLPAGVDGTVYEITNCGSTGNTLTVDGDGAEEINGSITQDLDDEDSIRIVFESTEEWRIF